MKPEDYKLLQDTASKVDELNRRLSVLTDLYYRTHMIDKTVFSNKVVFNNDAQIGKNTSSKVGFYGKTPVDQLATISDPSGGATIDSQARTAINTIIDRLQEIGLLA